MTRSAKPSEGMRHEVERIDNTVRALLDRARPRLKSVRSTSLAEVVGRAVNLARGQVANAASDGRLISIDFAPPTDPLTFPVDPAQIEDAVLNLIINAIESAESNGQVKIRVARSENSRDEDYQEFEAVIEVSDNGRGISEEDLTRIFNPFFTTRPGGTGLGLPAVRRIVRAHGGRVEVRSAPGEGSTFTIHLPPLTRPSKFQSLPAGIEQSHAAVRESSQLQTRICIYAGKNVATFDGTSVALAGLEGMW